MLGRLNLPAVLCVSLWLACSMCATASAQTASNGGLTKIRFGDVTGNAYPTLIVAQLRGYFEKERLVIERFPLAGSGLITEALAAGNIDLGNTALMSSMLATAKGGKTRLVSGLESTFTDKNGKPWEATCVVARSEDGIKTLDDLRGKRFADKTEGGEVVLRQQLRSYRGTCLQPARYSGARFAGPFLGSRRLAVEGFESERQQSFSLPQELTISKKGRRSYGY